MGIPGNLEAGTTTRGSYRNTCGSVGIPGNLEAGTITTGICWNNWGAIGISGNFESCTTNCCIMKPPLPNISYASYLGDVDWGNQ